MVAFSVGADPKPDESLPGFVLRMAQRMRFPKAERLAGRVGLRQPGSAFNAADLGPLADLIGTDPALVEAIAYRPLSRMTHHRFLGASVHREFIDVSRRHLCPLCLSESLHHRACWDLALATACADHGVRLIGACLRCKRRLGWSWPDIGRCRCGADMRAIAAGSVSDPERVANRALLDLLGAPLHPWLPNRLARFERSHLLKLLMCLGMFLTGWRKERRIETLVAAGPDAAAAVLLAGVGALRNWPEPLHRFLGEQRSQTASRPGRYGARRDLGAFYDWLTLMEPGEVKSALAEAAADYVQTDPVLARRVHRSRLLAVSGPLAAASLDEAGRALKRSDAGVRRLMAAGLLPETTSEGRGVPMTLDRQAIVKLGARLDGSLTLEEAAKALAISKSRLRRLVTAGVLTPMHRAATEGWGRWALERSAIARLMEPGCLGQNVIPVGRTVSFQFAAESCRRHGIAFAEFVRMIQDEVLLVAALDQNAFGLKRMRFARADLGALRPSPAAGDILTVQAAAERLGLKWGVVSHLVQVGLIPGSPGRIPLSEVERFAKEYVTGAQLARQLGTSPRGLAARLAASGVVPVVGPGIDGSRQNIFRKAKVTDI